MGVSATQYTWEFFQNFFKVYGMFRPQCHLVYVGSTAVGLGNRHRTRAAKMTQLHQGKLVSCEVALRFWKTTGTFGQYIPIVIHLSSNIQEVRSEELILIQRAQPMLNMPWILKYYKTSGAKHFTSTPTSAGFKLLTTQSRQDVV